MTRASLDYSSLDNLICTNLEKIEIRSLLAARSPMTAYLFSSPIF